MPVCRVERGPFEFLRDVHGTGAFAAIIVEGILLRRIRVGHPVTLRLLGVGDIVGPPGRESPLITESTCSVLSAARLAVLGDEVLAAARRWPRLVAGLYARCATQTDRALAQLTISQLPRVSDRLLAMLWLLAESSGRVTSSGVVLPLSLTHDLLGGLIGARRPTVTLAIGELIDRGAVIRQDRGWLLLEGVAERGPAPRAAENATTLPDITGPWSATVEEPPDRSEEHAELLATVRDLRQRHEARRDQVREQLEQVRQSRERVARARAERERNISSLHRLHH